MYVCKPVSTVSTHSIHVKLDDTIRGLVAGNNVTHPKEGGMVDAGGKEASWLRCSLQIKRSGFETWTGILHCVHFTLTVPLSTQVFK